MNKTKKGIVIAGVLLLLWIAAIQAQAAAPLDTLVFGNTVSESAHALTAPSTEVISGALGEPGRRALPLNPVDIYGGSFTFTMAVDPVWRNYVTVKLWGSDDTDYQMGRFYLCVPVNGTDYQVGYRHEGDYMPLSVTTWHPPLPGRFFYSTTLLPLSMTKGKTSITLKIVSAGRIYPLGSGGPPSGNYQYTMDRASRSLYQAYTHIDPFLDVSGEVQGAAPTLTTRPSPGEETMASGGAFYNGVNNRINNRLNTQTSVANFDSGDVAYLARSYSVAGLAGYQNQAVVDKVVALLDAFTSDYYANTNNAQGWGGAYGGLGRAIFYLQNQLTPAILDTVVNYGGGNNKTRRAAWGDVLHASREWGRLSDRRTLSNQAIIADGNIYCANKGLLVLGDSRAFTETVAQRYLKETCGLMPWLGNDLPGGGSAKPYGSSYYQVTSKGQTREWGFVGAGYGELAYHVAGWYRLTGNTEFRDQAVKMAKARAAFRRPAIEVSGSSNYRTMEVISLLAWRGAHESDGNYAGYVGYADTANTGEGGKGMLVAAASGDSSLIGYAKQMLADNQFFTYLDDSSGYYNTIEALESFADYQTVKAAADSGIRLPMTDGQLDFAWADEGNRILALKRGNDRLWITAYWQAKAGTGINGVARFHFSTPSYDQYGVIETTPRGGFGGTFTRPNMIDMPEKTPYLPPDPPTNAYAGELLPLGRSPVDAAFDDPFRGKADFYAFRFGRYLIGLNANAADSYTLKTPVGFTSATNLVTGATLSGTVTVAPNSTVALDLGTTTDTAPVPNAPLAMTATGSSTPLVALNWSAANGAVTYTVRRSTTQGGPYTALPAGTGITTNTFTDTTVTAGGVYYYVVAASNANGTSYDSVEAVASAGVPLPWTANDVGAVGLAGNSSYVNESFTLSGAGSTVGGSADSFHFTSLSVTGDGVLIARLASRVLSGSNADKIGLMIREDLTSGSRFFSIMIDKAFSDQSRLAYRTSPGGGATYPVNGSSVTLPHWLKVERVGNLFSCFISPDGVSWTQIGSPTSITMNATVRFGLFVCSRNTGAAAQATFDNVTASGWTPPSGPPPAPTGLSATGGNAQVALSWTASTGATSYNVKRATVSGGPYTTITNVATTSVTNTGLVNGTTYYYVVSALNADGESANSAQASATPQVSAPSAPSGLVATGGDAQVGLTWNASGGATSYNVKRATVNGGPYTTITNVAGTSFVNTGLANGTTYYYVVSALNAGGESANSAQASATPQVSAPTAPSGLAATGGDAQVGLTWNASSGATSYNVKRGTVSGGPYNTITNLVGTSFVNTGLINGTAYYYVVSALNAGGESANSSQVSATPQSSLPSPWVTADIGAVSATGSANHTNGTFTVTGSGADIWGSADEFRYVYQTASGNCSIVARVNSVQNVHPNAKAGVMIRESLNANSRHAMANITPSAGIEFLRRTSTGGSTTGTSVSGLTAPYWLRVTRSNNTLTASYSTNGTSWTTIGSQNINMSTGVYIGLIVNSHVDGTLCTSTFTNVTATP